MVASIKPHRDAIGLSDGLLLIDGRPAIESYTELKTVLLPLTDEMM